MSALTIPPVTEAGRTISPRLTQRGATASRGHLYVVPDVHVPTPQRERQLMASAPLKRSPKVAQRAEAKHAATVVDAPTGFWDAYSESYSVDDLTYVSEANVSWKTVLAFVAGLILAVIYIGTMFGVQQASQLTVTYVAAGDSLWSIALAHTPENGDVEDVMQQIRFLNGLQSSTLQVGQSLKVPVK